MPSLNPWKEREGESLGDRTDTNYALLLLLIVLILGAGALAAWLL